MVSINYLRELFKSKDKKTLVNIGMALAIGVVLLVISSTFYKPSGQNGAADASQKTDDSQTAVSNQSELETAYETQLQKRMEETLSLVDGVGTVKVMLTISYGREIIVAEDKTANESNTKETDPQGGERTTGSSTVDEKRVIITDKNGVSHPLILKEIQPKVEGVVIIAEGGDNIFVKESLTKAAEALLGLGANKVQVLKMKK